MPKLVSLQLLYLPWIFATYVLFVAFGGTLISFMTILETTPLIDTIDKLDAEILSGRMKAMTNRGGIYYDILKVNYYFILLEMVLLFKVTARKYLYFRKDFIDNHRRTWKKLKSGYYILVLMTLFL